MVPVPRRRALETVTAVGALALSGCLFEQEILGGLLFVENRTDEPHRIDLSVRETADGGSDDQIVDQRYRIPPAHALQFEAVFESGYTYEITAVQPDVAEGGRNRLTVAVETCDEDDPSDRLDVLILVGPNGPDVSTYSCDRGYSETDDLTYVDPAEYQVEE